MTRDLAHGLFGSSPADFGPVARTQALRNSCAQLDTRIRLSQGQRLRVGIGDNEVHPLELCLNHVVDGVATRSANAKNRNTGTQLRRLSCHRYAQVDTHVSLRKN